MISPLCNLQKGNKKLIMLLIEVRLTSHLFLSVFVMSDSFEDLELCGILGISILFDST